MTYHVQKQVQTLTRTLESIQQNRVPLANVPSKGVRGAFLLL